MTLLIALFLLILIVAILMAYFGQTSPLASILIVVVGAILLFGNPAGMVSMLTTGTGAQTPTPVAVTDTPEPTSTPAPPVNPTPMATEEAIAQGPTPTHIGGWGTGVGRTGAHDWNVSDNQVLIVWGVEVDGMNFAARVYQSDPGELSLKDAYGFVVHEEYGNEALCEALNGAGQIDIVDAPSDYTCAGFEDRMAA